MDNFAKDRIAMLPGARPVPKVVDLEKQFISFWNTMRRNLKGGGRKDTLDYSQKRHAKSLAEAAYERRRREAGFGSVAEKDLPALLALVNEGGRLSGPLTEDAALHLSADLHAESPWMREVSTWLMKQMQQNTTKGRPGLVLPPVILAGPPGIGKSHYARSLANLAGLPVRMIDVGGGSAGFRISGTEKGWGSAQPGIPVETLLAQRVANPIMVVDEVDKAGTTFGSRGTSSSLTTSMLQMLEPGTARRFECPYYRVPFDMSHVIWIMTANDIDQVPAPLRDRSRVFALPKLSVEAALAFFDRRTTGCDKDPEWSRCCTFIADMCDRPDGISLRQIEQLATAVRAPMPRAFH